MRSMVERNALPIWVYALSAEAERRGTTEYHKANLSSATLVLAFNVTTPRTSFLPGITESWEILSSHFFQQVWSIARTFSSQIKC